MRLIKKDDIQVLHLHCYGASTFGRLAGLITGIPTIIHDYDTEVYFPYPWYLGSADRLLASKTRVAIAASPMVRDFLVHKRKIEPGRIRLMPHAIPIERYTPVASEEVLKLKAHLSWDGHAKIIGTVTKLGPQRGNDLLLRAAAEVLKVFPNALFLLIYKPTLFHRLPNKKYVAISRIDTIHMVTELKILATELGIEKNVRFIESPKKLDALVSACDLIVAPFLSERFSSVHLLESMAMGKPIIATNIGEQREIIQDGINGYLVAPGNVRELAERILQVLADPEELARMSYQARLKSDQYSVDTYVQSLQNLYEELTTADTN